MTTTSNGASSGPTNKWQKVGEVVEFGGGEEEGGGGVERRAGGNVGRGEHGRGGRLFRLVGAVRWRAVVGADHDDTRCSGGGGKVLGGDALGLDRLVAA